MKHLIPLLVVLLLALVVSAWAVHAATYNFYFNNTEQGANSTANPSLRVADDGTVTKTNAEGKPVVTNSQLTSGEVPVSNASTPVAGIVPAPEFKHFRLSSSAAYYQARLYDPSGVKWAASFAFFFNREIGLNVFGIIDPDAEEHQLQAGAELEIVPIRISLGRIENLFELAVMGGASHSQLWTEPHAGMRLNVNLGESWGLTATGRYARDYAMADAGLALHF